MRISDWSSDVCSSDLDDHRRLARADPRQWPHHPRRPEGRDDAHAERRRNRRRALRLDRRQACEVERDRLCQGRRSEEHTSELQSLMRISYAVFCLKKKKKNTDDDKTNYI